MFHFPFLVIPLLLDLLPHLELNSSGKSTVPVYAGPPLAKGAFPTMDSSPPWIIAHRGSSGLHPEHTLEAYSLSAHLGAHWIEPDLVLTRDGVPVCRHDAILGETTDVASRPEYAHRRRNLTIPVLGTQWSWSDEWAVEDFTLKELRGLRAIQRPNLGVRSSIYNGHFSIPTFEEVLQHYVRLAPQFPTQLLGIIPEIKHPEYFNQLMGEERYFENTVLSLLNRYLDPSQHRVIIQCFYPETLGYIKDHSFYDTLLLSNLLTWKYMTHKGIQQVPGIASYFGPTKELLMGLGIKGLLDQAHDDLLIPSPEDVDRMGGWVSTQEIIPYLHRHHVRVIPFTAFPAGEPHGVDEVQMTQWMRSGIDGLFCDDVSMGHRGLSIASQ
ncbi:PLC-like phosphodiesterase [Piptocephalis cylindrospora]|uniref:glycerophosphodiester phosphodiesterase n=1 Tax=Piptocephalis cylindrospora TaxID=1907219 RepID=A0A4P9Y704_9FUNG|nr:PLC-like phosphodiesterase [Piptocephalis cylindrospora]|eukprot:RKP14773.1 PLC-like phosphodiesterase [Piptocephalis cylindrospora]